MASILIVMQSSAFEDGSAREAQDMAMALAATEHQVSLFYRQAGVLQLLPLLQPIAVKEFTKAQKLFNLYEIEHIYVCAASAKRFQITSAEMQIPVIWVDEDWSFLHFQHVLVY